MLTKIIKMVDGKIEKLAYGDAYRVEAVELPVANIVDLSSFLTELEAEKSSCVIRARLKTGETGISVRRKIHDEPQKGFVAPFEERPDGLHHMLADMDKVPCPSWLAPEDRLYYLVSLLPEAFHNVTFHYRWSGSAGLDGWETMSCHLWFWLAQPMTCSVLRARMIAEQWHPSIDRALANPVQVHYTATPIFVDMFDPIAGARSGLVRFERDEVDLPTFVPKVAVIRDRDHVATREPGEARAEWRGGLGSVERYFLKLLDKVGPGYHEEIRAAICFYCAFAPVFDRDFLIAEVERAIREGVPGASDKSTYDREYINRSIQGAIILVRGGSTADLDVPEPKPRLSRAEVDAILRHKRSSK